MAHRFKGQSVVILKQINAVLNSLDRLEVRGRDSAGLSAMFHLSRSDFEQFEQAIARKKISQRLSTRSKPDILANDSIRIRHANDSAGASFTTVTLTYKIAAEIGSLGDNGRFLRAQIQKDRIFQQMLLPIHIVIIRFAPIPAGRPWALLPNPTAIP